MRHRFLIRSGLLAATVLLASGCLHDRASDSSGEEGSATGNKPVVDIRFYNPLGELIPLVNGDEIRIPENFSALNMTATLINDDSSRTRDLSFSYQLPAVTATRDSDYGFLAATDDSGQQATMRFRGAGSSNAVSERSHNIYINQDNTYEVGIGSQREEEFWIALGNADGVSLPTNGFKVFIQDVDPPPELSVHAIKTADGNDTSLSTAEFKESVGAIQIELSLDPSQFEGNITVPVSFSGTAQEDADYINPAYFVVSKETTAQRFPLLITDDALAEDDETLVLSLGQPDHATLGADTSVNLTLVDDEGNGQLNQSGIDGCYSIDAGDLNYSQLDCSYAEYPNQDGYDQAGAAFNFLEDDSTGDICVEDLNTGLMWEQKEPLDKSDLRYNENVYNWYVPFDNANGGNPGVVGSTGGCVGLETCDTLAYVQMVNSRQLCGHSDWRLPRVDELLSIVHFGVAADDVPRVASKFPHTKPFNGATLYWTSTPVAGFKDRVWVVDFNTGELLQYGKSAETSGSGLAYIRVVRSGREIP